MWTLFDPLANPANSDSKARRREHLASDITDRRVSPSVERILWLLEPTGPLSCKLNMPFQKGH